MSNHDLDWVAAQRPQRSGADTEAHDRALLALLRHATSHPHPDRDRSRRAGGIVRLRVFGFTAAAGVAAIAAAVALSAQGGPRQLSGAGNTPLQAVVSHHATARASLIRLADNVSQSALPPGDATLVQRTTHTGGQNVTVYDLYGDDNAYYFSQDESGLAAQVSGNHTLAAGLFGREVAAAKEAAAGNVQQGALDMANAPAPNGKYRITSTTETTLTPAQAAAAKVEAKLTGTAVSLGTNFDNWAWEDSQDALIAGAGDPQVRAGVLEILALLPGVTVAHGTSSDGQPTLVLTGGADEVGSGYQEQLTINAATGVPIGFVGGPPNGAPATQVDFQVARVTLANVANGQVPTL
jgi:hypothetical protein